MNTLNEPKIVEKAAFRVVGLRYEGKNEHGEIPAMWDQFIPRIGGLVPDPAKWVAYGISRSIQGVDVNEKWEYLAGVELPHAIKIPSDMVVWEIPALTYAVLPANDVPGIGPITNYFEKEWLPHSQEWEADVPMMIELYPETYSQDLVIYLYFPIRRKGK